MDTHADAAISTVATAPSPATSGTSLVVTAGEGARFPSGSFDVTIWPSGAQPSWAAGSAAGGNFEMCRATISTDTLTLTRAQYGTSARTVVVGDQIALNVTKKSLTDIETAAVGATVVNSGFWVGQRTIGALATGAITQNQEYAFVVQLKAGTLTRIGCYVGSGQASNTFRLGIRNNSNGYPGSVLLDAGTVDASSGGNKTITISQAVADAAYWLTITEQAGAGGATTAINPSPGVPPVGYFINDSGNIFQSVVAFTQTGVSGALGSWSATVAGITTNAPMVFVRN